MAKNMNTGLGPLLLGPRHHGAAVLRGGGTTTTTFIT
jgi:hypothetical protein